MADPVVTFDPTIVRAVAFDGFGTVFDYPVSRFKETFARLAATLTPPVDGAVFWERWLEIGKKVWGQLSPEEGPQLPVTQPFRPYRELWPVQFANTFAAVEASGDPEAATAFLFAEIEHAAAYPEAPATLEAIRSRYPIALVSNSDDVFLSPPLVESGLRFDVVVSSEGARSYKPERAIFEHAARALDVDLSHILYVGDSPRADIGGALAAGLQIAWLNREEQTPPEGTPEPHLRITTLDSLLPVLGIDPPD